MPDELFSGIPSLDDEAGTQDYLNNSALSALGYGADPTPAALQVQTPAEPAEPAAEPTAPAPAPAAPAAPQYTAEQVAAIIARNRELEAAARQPQPQPQPQRQPVAPQSAYTPQQAAIIKQLIDRGVPLDRIAAALAGRTASNQAQSALMTRLNNVEQYLQRQEYEAAQNAFVDKMTTFGNKFGLSEADLVTFGNKAMTMGINLTEVPSEAIENVFKAVYPDQYAIRSQRIAGASASHIYGGASTPEAPRASAARLEDAYVDAFLRQAMPNQYGKNTK